MHKRENTTEMRCQKIQEAHNSIVPGFMELGKRFRIEEKHTYVSNWSNILISSIVEMCASSREYNLFTFDNHPILIRLLMCKVSMRYVCFPYFISTFWPLNWDLNMQQLIMSKTSLFIYHNREIYTISAHNMTATTQFFSEKGQWMLRISFIIFSPCTQMEEELSS